MKILFIALSGIGNTILATPMIQYVRQQYPGARIDLLVHKKVFGECLRGADVVDNIYPMDSLLDKIKTGMTCFMQRYNYSVCCFPSNKFQFNLLSFLIGARKRCTHRYFVGNHLSFLMNGSIDADPTLHDVDQNMRLLSCLGLEIPRKYPPLLFHLDKQDKEFSLRFLKRHKITKKDHIIGVHAGGGPIGKQKRWGVKNFAKELNKKKGTIMIFGGPEEAHEKKNLQKLLNYKSYVFSGSLNRTASLIARCNYFLSNDTGLMHIASCFNIEQKAIFTGTSISRTRPWNKKANVIDLTNDIKFKYPFWSVDV